MTEKLKEVIKREIGKLPKETQNVLNFFGWEKISEEIGKKYLLNESELNDLQVQTLLVLIGLVDADYYANNVENELELSKNEAEKISAEIFQKIFNPINDILIKNIKNSREIKNSTPEQSLNFILSGGDYSVFLEKKDNTGNLEETDTGDRTIPVFSITEDLKRKN